MLLLLYIRACRPVMSEDKLSKCESERKKVVRKKDTKEQKKKIKLD